MNKILKVVESTSEKYNLLNNNETVLVGVSGGADSIALLHILKRIAPMYSLKLIAAHLNHMMRSTAADEDENFVVSICKEWDIPCVTGKTDVLLFSRKWKLSIEETGRKARFDFFTDLVKKYNAQKLALAHHKDDNAETVLHNIVRGTGLYGLRGIHHVREGYIIRPMLDVNKNEILEYCFSEGLKFRVDETNKDLRYTRNRLRYGLLPYIKKEFNPNIVDSIVRMSDIVSEDDEFLNMYCNEMFSSVVKTDKHTAIVSLKLFNMLHKSLKRRLLRMAIENLKEALVCIELNHIDKLIRMFTESRQGAELNLPDNLFAKKSYGYGYITNEGKSLLTKPYDYVLNIPGKVFVQEVNLYISAKYVNKDSISIGGFNPVYIDADNLRSDLVVRNRRTGDQFTPLGVNFKKSIKEFFIDKKIQKEKRYQIPLITDGDEIIWIAGLQISELFKIKQSTSTVLELKYEKAKMVEEQDVQ